MKRFFPAPFAVFMVALLFSTAVIAQDKDAEFYYYQAEQTLKSQFGVDCKANWSLFNDNLIRADFEIDGEKMSMFFDRENKYMATTHQVEMKQLPLRARLRIRDKLTDFNPTQIVHYQTRDTDVYIIEGYDAEVRQYWKVDRNGNIERFRPANKYKSNS